MEAENERQVMRLHEHMLQRKHPTGPSLLRGLTQSVEEHIWHVENKLPHNPVNDSETENAMYRIRMNLFNVRKQIKAIKNSIIENEFYKANEKR